MKLVDAAVELVEQGKGAEAIGVLKEGIATFEPNFPDCPELGELHNQVSLLSLVNGDAEAAVAHAARALDLTRKHFGTTGALVGHRQLRLGVAYFAQGRVTDSVGLLHGAKESLSAVSDSSQHEAQFYLDLVMLAGAKSAPQVLDYQDKLLASMKEMKSVFGAESMIVALALSQHDRVVQTPLSGPEPDTLLCEALLKQHARLLEFVNPESEDLAVCYYKLATFYYTNDVLVDAQAYIRKAADGLRAIVPDEHDLMALCKHRLGMICAASGDHRAATSLLTLSRKRYSGSTDGGVTAGGAVSGLGREAEVGLAMAKFRGLPPSTDTTTRKAVLEEVRTRLTELGTTIGADHMLTRGALRHFAGANIRAGQ